MEIVSTLATNYFIVVRIISEGRLLLMYCVITNYTHHLNTNFNKYEYHDAINLFSTLQELTTNVNLMFPATFLMYIAFSFVTILARAMLMYCKLFGQTFQGLSYIDVVVFLYGAFNLFYIIVIPYQCIIQVRLNCQKA